MAPTCPSALELVAATGKRSRRKSKGGGKAATAGLSAIRAQEVREQMSGL